MTVHFHRFAGYSCLIFAAQNTCAGTEDIAITPKATGIAISVETQQQDYTLTSLSISPPLPVLKQLEAAKDQIKARSDVQTTAIRMDRWVTPNINLCGSVAKISGEGVAKLPALPGLSLPDIKVDADGMSYSAGATAVVRKDSYFGALTYTHTFYKPDTLDTTNESSSVMPTVGKITRAGTFSLSMLYQDSKGDYIGKANTPFGEMTANFSAENKNNISWLAGYRTQLADNLYVRAIAELGGREGIRLDLSKRF